MSWVANVMISADASDAENVGALNHADLEALRQRVAECPWQEPNAVQLFVMDQKESFFRLWMIRAGDLRQFAPLEPSEEDAGFYRRRGDWSADGPGAGA